MRKIISPCGFHCIKVNHLGVRFSEQEILKDVNLHMHCGSLNAIIGKNGARNSISPVCGMSPSMARINVDFPAPFFPIIAFSDPQCI